MLRRTILSKFFILITFFYHFFFVPYCFAANEQIITSEPPLPSRVVFAIRRFDNFLEDYFYKSREPGCAVAIVYRNRVVYMRTLGVRRIGSRERINADTVFQLGSVSKTFTATLAAILQQKGQLNINHPVRYYLPHLHFRRYENDIRVRNLLNHSTGIPKGGFNRMIERYTPYPKMIDVIQRTPIQAPPGRRFAYHNVVFSLTGDVIQRATGHSYQYELASELLQPLRMEETYVNYSDFIKDPNRAYPHVMDRKGRFVPATKYSTSYYNVTPAAGISSSISDMAKYLNLQLGAYPKILNERILSEMHQPTISTPEVSFWFRQARDRIYGTYYALGWRVLNYLNKRLVFHGGWLKGFTNFVGFIPEDKIGIVVLHNSETRFPSKVAMRFFDIYFGLPEKDW